MAYPAATRAAVAFPLSMRASQERYRSSLPPPLQLDDIRRSRTGLNGMRGPCVQSSGLFPGEFVSLINRSDASQLRCLVRQQHVNHNRIEAESRQCRNARAPQIVQAPRRNFGAEPRHRFIERGFRPRETGNRRLACRGEDQVTPLNALHGPQNRTGRLNQVNVMRPATLHPRGRDPPRREIVGDLAPSHPSDFIASLQGESG